MTILKAIQFWNHYLDLQEIQNISNVAFATDTVSNLELLMLLPTTCVKLF